MTAVASDPNGSAPFPPRPIARRILGRSQLETVEQMARQQQGRRNARTATASTPSRTVFAALSVPTVDGLSAAVDRLHATLVAADPQMLRTVIESVRTDVTRRPSADVNSQLAWIAEG